jgi:hypothetical protein
MPRVTRDRSWKVPAATEAIDHVVGLAVQSQGMTMTPSATDQATFELRGGSQADFRTLGGWIVEPHVFPKKGTVRRVAADGGVDVDVHLEDTMGFGIMDRRTKRRYREALDAILAELDRALGSLGGAPVGE